jgi:hypothetical protein
VSLLALLVACCAFSAAIVNIGIEYVTDQSRASWVYGSLFTAIAAGLFA